jgi:hypothetical protein
VLQRKARFGDLTLVGRATRLLDQLGALRGAGGTQRMALAEQTPDGLVTTRPP